MQRNPTKKVSAIPKTLNKIKGTKKQALELKLSEDMVIYLKNFYFFRKNNLISYFRRKKSKKLLIFMIQRKMDL